MHGAANLPWAIARVCLVMRSNVENAGSSKSEEVRSPAVSYADLIGVYTKRQNRTLSREGPQLAKMRFTLPISGRCYKARFLKMRDCERIRVFEAITKRAIHSDMADPDQTDFSEKYISRVKKDRSQQSRQHIRVS